MEADRLTAWDRELRAAHARLRAALAATREALEAGTPAPEASSDLLLFCVGFCAALDGHHRSEDRTLFPAVQTEHPELEDVIGRLMQDHAMLSQLLGSLRAAVEKDADADAVRRHLDGVGALMESHFRYEERQLLEPLRALTLPSAVPDVLGPL